MSPEQGVSARLIRINGFIHKELLGVFQQPRLVVTLVIAPFLILLVFGLGYRETLPPFRTLLVLDSDQGGLSADREELKEAFVDSIDLEGVTTDLAEAHRRLRRDEVQLLIIAPKEPLAALDHNEKAEFRMVHTEVDPVVRASIALVARLSVEEFNRRVVVEMMGAAQAESDEAEAPLSHMRAEAIALVSALERGDRAEARDHIQRIRQELVGNTGDYGTGTGLYSSVAAALGAGGIEALSSLADSIDEAEDANDAAALESARELEAALTEMESTLGNAEDLDPALLVSPFSAEVTQLADLPSTPAVFYAPGTAVLLIQHLAVTLAAMSLVRERQLGLTELFQVSPLSPGELIAGKYIAFLMICAAVAASLTGTMTILGVPLGWDVWQYVVTLSLVILASIGLGFLIAGFATTDSQAVQYTMMALLVSIFFTGFVLPIDRLAGPVQAASFLIPARYGIVGLQDMMLRGVDVDVTLLAGLAVYAAALGTTAWGTIRRSAGSGL